jgi:hypothetical protein
MIEGKKDMEVEDVRWLDKIIQVNEYEEVILNRENMNLIITKLKDKISNVQNNHLPL